LVGEEAILSDELYGRLAAYIESGKFAPQSQLPTERELAEAMQSSRWRLRKALARLESEGRLWRHVGRGTFVGSKPAAAGAALRLLSQHSSPMEIVEARRLLEPGLAAAAAVHATPAQVGDLRDAARKCAASRNFESFEIWDERLHLTIAAACGNGLLRALYDALNAVRKEVVWGAMSRTVLRPEQRERSSRQHARIVEAIAHRDPEQAAKAMREHLDFIAETYRSLDVLRQAEAA
jgi:DNA-binding FadR family transcriptional regulator